jgi:hypothetical protein
MTTKAKFTPDRVINNYGQSVHVDARIWLNETDRVRYGGARMIDAKTFVTDHPEAKLEQGFAIGTYHYDL